jgi:hypothetical protein
MLGKGRETRLVILSPELLKLYKFPVTAVAPVLFTFTDPEDSMDLLCQDDVISEADSSQLFRVKSPEEQWGELELRLAFFRDITKWQ